MGTSSAEAHTVFVYGSLLSDEVVSILFKRLPKSYPATLQEFHRFSIKRRTYLAILPAKRDKVIEKVLFSIIDKELEVLSTHDKLFNQL